ncbi:MAG: hypothetical protein GAK31_03287 [Stenotrophomonas maltophilia]|uniref:Calcium-binding protein n=1 Tax=Stenotrophomonas maltophilia TaxID=40324 RepID=A0A7V8JL75_STEMA|nr:MAG: hypothetical protein GAK31_03287 [Stenotrophomonas maltophilia]
MRSFFRRFLLLALVVTCGASAADTGIATISAQIREHAGMHCVLVLVEWHGTRETPLLVADLLETSSRDGRPVVLALEVPRGEHGRLRHYMASAGDAQVRALLGASPFWAIKDDQHDGRRSRDMLDLIEAARALKAQGRDVAVTGVDLDRSNAGNQRRDDAMVTQVRRLHDALLARGRLLVLTGNVHALRVRPARAPAAMQQRPMASQLRDLDIYSVRVDAQRGSAWGCFDRCRPWPLPERDDAQPRASGGVDRLYDLWVFLPQLSVGRLRP